MNSPDGGRFMTVCPSPLHERLSPGYTQRLLCWSCSRRNGKWTTSSPGLHDTLRHVSGNRPSEMEEEGGGEKEVDPHGTDHILYDLIIRSL